MSLEDQASRFAEDLTKTLIDILGECDSFTAQSIDNGSKFVIKQSRKHGVPLLVSGTPLLSLKIKYECRLDSQQKYIAVDESEVVLYAGEKASGEPLFRYEYVREPVGNIPSAHIQVHAHRDAFTATMVRAGKSTTRSSRRARSLNVPRLSELHFPVGGPRFRPSLEDILEMIIEEFGVDHTQGFRLALRNGRKSWRKKQTRAVVRDDPKSAVEVLQSLGYEIHLKDGGIEPAMRDERLEQF